ncbi:MAG TPA: HEPN domain-containing protein [Candidatus Avalokitesvara rifleensis]|uniref:HEPN domain-containing protein n=1 Tax=Candidatus Avalokitesvara rifleensis TaxID=3367620 RepID=UPI004024E6B9
MKKDVELARKLQKIMAKSKKCLETAKQHHEQDNYDETASRAYYAVFHSLQASLLTLGLSSSKHSGVKGSFNKEFIHKGIFPKEFSQKIERLFRDRQVGDYGYEETLSKKDSEQDIADAETVVSAIKKYLAERNLL